MTVPQSVNEPGDDALARSAAEHLWMHFTRHSSYEDGRGHVPVIVRGDGAWIYDDSGKKYLDGLAGLFTVQLGHGRTELAEAAAKQAAELAFFPLWSYAHPKAIELAERLVAYAPGDLDRVFFTTGGGEAVETAWKVAKQFFKLTGKPYKHKVISRSVAYHGTPQGALSITGIPDAKKYFEPLVPGAHKVPNTNFYRAPYHSDDIEAFVACFDERVLVMAEREDVAAHAVDLGVVGRNRAVEPDAEDLALVLRPVLRADVGCRRQILRVVGVAAVCAEVAAAVPNRQIQPAIGAEGQPAADVIVVRRQARQDVHRLDEHTRGLIVPVAPDRHPPGQRRSRGVVVGEDHVHEVVAGTPQQVGVKCQAEQAVLCHVLVHFRDGDGDAPRPVRRVDAHDPAARSLGDP
jgi:hypothetical protein